MLLWEVLSSRAPLWMCWHREARRGWASLPLTMHVCTYSVYLCTYTVYFYPSCPLYLLCAYTNVCVLHDMELIFFYVLLHKLIATLLSTCMCRFLGGTTTEFFEKRYFQCHVPQIMFGQVIYSCTFLRYTCRGTKRCVTYQTSYTFGPTCCKGYASAIDAGVLNRTTIDTDQILRTQGCPIGQYTSD